MLVLPAPAEAATFCVNGPCPSGPQTHFTLQFALNAADATPERDRIEIGPGTLLATNSTDVSGNDVDIVGAGRTLTTVQGAAQAATALDLSDPSSTVSDLRVRLASGDNRVGIGLTGGVASRVTVDGTSGAVTGSRGFLLENGSRVSDSAALLSNTQQNRGIDARPGANQTVTIDNVELTGRTGLEQRAAGTVVARRLSIYDTELGVGATSSGTVDVSNSLIRVAGTSPTALYASAAASPVLNARHVTAIGGGTDGPPGVSASAINGQTAIVNLKDSIIRNFTPSLAQTAFSGGASSVNVSYSDYGDVLSTNTGTGTGGVVQGDGNVDDSDPLFANAAGGDFSLLPTSPLIDAGDPTAPSTSTEPTDFAGNPRVNDGNGDGTPRTDMGAFEYQRPAPSPQPPVNPQPPAVQPPAPKDTAAPTLSGVRLSNSTFRVGAKSTAVSAAKKKTPKGTVLRYKLSEAATVKIAVEQRTVGARIRSKGKTVCAARTRARRKAGRCDRYLGIRTLTRKGKVGANALSFTGRIAGRALKPGVYRLRLTASDGAGNRSGSKVVAFKVVR